MNLWNSVGLGADIWSGMGDSRAGVDLSYLKILRSEASPDDAATFTGSELVQSYLVNLTLPYIHERA